MINLNSLSIMIGTHDPDRLGEFYEKVFGKPGKSAQGQWYEWSFGKEGSRCFLSIGEHSEVKGVSKEPQRVIFNFETKEVKEDFKRIKDLGAKVVAEPYELEGYQGMWIATFADPDGNYFQLMTPWEK